MRVDELRVEMDRRFDAVDQRFEAVDQRFEAIDRRFEAIIALILSEGERTRRHMDIAVEQMRSERNLALDKAITADDRAARLMATNAADHVEFSARLDDHERRLTRVEQQREA